LAAQSQATNPVPPSSLVTERFSSQPSQFGVPHTWLHNDSDWQLRTDNTCLKLRTYKVARDGPRTDSTHFTGYTTCTPAARFQTHSIIYTVPPVTH
ncbi:MAG: hypothetical protein WAM47_02065, partial [Candidatus Sulfotelmatobacter sp.]